MNLLICLDEKNGMMFNKRRQSRDAEVCRKILDIAKGKRLFMTEYSAKLFPDADIVIHPEPEHAAERDDFCFLEQGVETLENAEQIFVFLWNRRYPGDVFFGFDLEKEGFILEACEEFQGKSHEKITLNIYRRKQ